MFGYRNKKDSGVIISGGRQIGTTLQCVHCGKHEMVIPGSGKKRGWCGMCTGFVCGKEPCMKHCVPYEARIEYVEALAEKNFQLTKKLLSRYPEIDKLRL